ncbi:MAG: hypothetical protein GF398_16485 [Chitinivibrionales bacterium]|nr:hypothetical protein [Chitinivibrionales bacterium]
MKDRSKVKLILFIGIALLVGGLAAASYRLWCTDDSGSCLITILEWTDTLGVLSLLAFVLIYALATLLFMPGSVLTLAAGALFGLVNGLIAASAGAGLGAFLAYLVSRFFLREAIARWLESKAILRPLVALINKADWKLLLLTRLSPLFPFNALNYAYGLSRIRPLAYLVVSWIGMLPGAFLYVYAGTMAGTLAKSLVAPEHMDNLTLKWIIFAAGLISTAVIVIWMGKSASSLLRKTSA